MKALKSISRSDRALIHRARLSHSGGDYFPEQLEQSSRFSRRALASIPGQTSSQFRGLENYAFREILGVLSADLSLSLPTIHHLVEFNYGASRRGAGQTKEVLQTLVEEVVRKELNEPCFE